MTVILPPGQVCERMHCGKCRERMPAAPGSAGDKACFRSLCENGGPENRDARKYRKFVYDENQRFIYPTSDWGFKFLLGSEENKEDA